MKPKRGVDFVCLWPHVVRTVAYELWTVTSPVSLDTPCSRTLQPAWPPAPSSSNCPSTGEGLAGGCLFCSVTDLGLDSPVSARGLDLLASLVRPTGTQDLFFPGTRLAFLPLFSGLPG